MKNFFYVWETIEWTITLTDQDGESVLDGYKDVVVSLEQGDVLVEKSGAELGIDAESDSIFFTLGQEDTSQFHVGTAKLQVNVYYDNETRDTSVMADIEVRRNLHEEVMS